MAQVAPALQEQLERLVELRRVGPVPVEHRSERVLGSEAGRLGAEHAPGEHAVLVALQRVDLAVVAEQPERLRALPGRRRVRREAAVEHDVRRDERRVSEVGVEERQAVADDERLVSHRPEREAREVVADAGVAARRLGAAARPERAPLGLQRVESLGAQQQPLRERRQVSQRMGAEVGLVDRDGSPPSELEALDATRRVDRVLSLSHGRAVVAVEERERDTEPPGVKRSAELRRADVGEEGVRDRREDPGPVARHAVGGERGTMPHTAQPVEREVDDGARGPAASATKPMPQPSNSGWRNRCAWVSTISSGREAGFVAGAMDREATHRPDPEPGSTGATSVSRRIVRAAGRVARPKTRRDTVRPGRPRVAGKPGAAARGVDGLDAPAPRAGRAMQ